MSKKLLIVLGSIFIISCLFLVSCEDKEQIIVKNTEELVEEDKKDNEVINKDEDKKDNSFLLNKKNELILENDDKITIYQENSYVVVGYSNDNKFNYSFDYFFNEDNIHIDFYSHNLVSSLTSDLSYLNKISKQYIKNKNAEKLTFKFKKGNEINIFSNEEEYFTYQNLTNIKINKHKNTYSIIINLIEEEYCNEDNFILFDKDNFNEKLIKLHNKIDINNLKCGKENILLINNKYHFHDERDFSLFSEDVILNSKKKIFETLNNDEVYINTIIKEDYVYINLNNLDKFNYSLDYEYNEKQKSINIIINKIPENWLSVDKIKINKNIFYKINKIYLEEREYRDYSGKKALIKKVTDNYSLFSFKNKNGYHYSYVNEMSCKYFSDQLIVEINDFNEKSNLFFLKDKTAKCKKYQTKKIAIDYNKFSIIEKNINNDIYNLGLSDFFNIEYKKGIYYFYYYKDYRVYNYKVINNQLYLYIDKPNNNYHILNQEIETLQIEQFSNINIINLYNDNTYKRVLDDNLKIYRDYKEKLKTNIRKYEGENNYIYYNLRINSISLDKNYISCNKKSFNIEEVKEGDNSYSLIINNDKKECKNSGVGLYIVKLIGSYIDVDFVDKRNTKHLDKLKNKHDRSQYNLKNALKNLDINFEFDVIYLNNQRKFVLKIDEFNTKSRFFHTLNIVEEKNTIRLDITETEDLKQNESQYFIFDTDNEFSELLIVINQIDSEKKFKIDLSNI